MRPLLVALAMFGVLAASCSSSGVSDGDDGDLIRFAAVPAEQDTDPTATYKDIIALLERSTGKRVQFVRSTDYNSVIEGLVSGKVDLAQLGPLSYVLARNNGAKITSIAALVRQGGEPIYHSYGIVAAHSPIVNIGGFKEAKVCFTDPASTSGYLFPSQALLSVGIDPKSGVTPVMAGGQDNAVLSVATGKCEAGFSEGAMVDHILIDKGKLKAGQVKVVWKSAPIPTSPVAIRDALPNKLRSTLIKTFTQDANKDRLVQLGICKNTDSCRVATDSSMWGFRPITDAAFDTIREVCVATHHEKCSKA